MTLRQRWPRSWTIPRSTKTAQHVWKERKRRNYWKRAERQEDHGKYHQEYCRNWCFAGNMDSPEGTDVYGKAETCGLFWLLWRSATKAAVWILRPIDVNWWFKSFLGWRLLPSSMRPWHQAWHQVRTGRYFLRAFLVSQTNERMWFCQKRLEYFCVMWCACTKQKQLWTIMAYKQPKIAPETRRWRSRIEH